MVGWRGVYVFGFWDYWGDFRAMIWKRWEMGVKPIFGRFLRGV